MIIYICVYVFFLSWSDYMCAMASFSAIEMREKKKKRKMRKEGNGSSKKENTQFYP